MTAPSTPEQAVSEAMVDRGVAAIEEAARDFIPGVPPVRRAAFAVLMVAAEEAAGLRRECDAARAELIRTRRERDEWRERADIYELVEHGKQLPTYEWAVMVGVDTEDEAPTELHLYDDPADAHELAQHVPGAWIARRRVVVGKWEPDPDADPNPFDDPFRLLLADRDRLAAELADLRSRLGPWAQNVKLPTPSGSDHKAEQSGEYDALRVGDPSLPEHGQRTCAASTSDGLLSCTRPDGHGGTQHVAEGQEQVQGVWPVEPPPGQRGEVVAGDLVHEAVLNACPDYMTDIECKRIADRVLAELADLDGVTVLRGPDSMPWTPPAEGVDQ